MATPIGNLADLSSRASSVLAAADLLLCEDTRVTAKLLRAHGVERPMIAYHDHNAAKLRPRILAQLHEGQAVALVSDAGTPLVSDPGYKLVRAVIDAGFDVFAVPGASAPLAALTVSGLPTDRFMFAGFLPSKSGARRRAIEELKTVPATLIWFESAQRLPAMLEDLAALFGERPAAVTRELTKRFEEVRRGSARDLADHYAKAGSPKGEVVVVVGPPDQHKGLAADDIDEALRSSLSTMSPSAAAAHVATLCDQPKRVLYSRALFLIKGTNKP